MAGSRATSGRVAAHRAGGRGCGGDTASTSGSDPQGGPITARDPASPSRGAKVPRLFRVVPEVGMRLSRCKHAILAEVFEANRRFWNRLVAQLPKHVPAWFANGRLPTVRGLLPRVVALAARPADVPPKVGEGTVSRVASAVVGGYQAALSLRSRARWIVGPKCVASPEKKLGMLDTLAIEAGHPAAAAGCRLAEMTGWGLRQLEAWLSDVEARTIDRLPRPRLTPTESDARWSSFLDSVAQDGTIEDGRNLHAESLAAAREDDPPPIDLVRGRDAPVLANARGTTVLFVPTVEKRDCDIRASCASHLHPAWAASGARPGRPRAAIAVPLTFRGWGRDPFLAGEVARVTLVAERSGAELRYRAQVALRKPVPPARGTDALVFAWIGVYPRLAAELVVDGRATEIHGMLDRAVDRMRESTLGLGPKKIGDRTEVAHRKLTHAITTELVRAAREAGARIVTNDPGASRKRLVSRERHGEKGRRERHHCSAWNHGGMVWQLEYKSADVGLPAPGSVYVRVQECPACGLGGADPDRRRSDCAHKAAVLRNRPGGEYTCEGCGYRAGFETSRLAALRAAWLLRHGER